MPSQEDYIYEESFKGEVKQGSAPSRKIIFLVVLLVLLLNFCVLAFVRRHMKRRLSQEVNERV